MRDVPEKLYKRLRARARRNGRSLNAEVLELIDEAVLRELTSDRGHGPLVSTATSAATHRTSCGRKSQVRSDAMSIPGR
jgi:plasmid stability protein